MEGPDSTKQGMRWYCGMRMWGVEGTTREEKYNVGEIKGRRGYKAKN